MMFTISGCKLIEDTGEKISQFDADMDKSVNFEQNLSDFKALELHVNLSVSELNIKVSNDDVLSYTQKANREELLAKQTVDEIGDTIKITYENDDKVKILSEFIPAKTKIVEIPLNEISKVLIGTKNFIKRNVAPDSDFVKNIRVLEKSKDFYKKKTISSMDILYVETFEKECYYMPIVKFDTRNVTKIVQMIQRINPELLIRVSSREYRTLRMASK